MVGQRVFTNSFDPNIYICNKHIIDVNFVIVNFRKNI